MMKKKIKERKRKEYRVKIGNEWKTYYSLASAARDNGIGYETLHARLREGWPLSKALSLPIAQWVRE